MADKSECLAPDVNRAVELYGNSLYRLACVMLRHSEDAKDAVQDTFLKYIGRTQPFNNGEHEKAWLIRVATNICKDFLRRRSRHSHLSLDEIKGIGGFEDNVQILDLLTALDEKYRIVIHLHYVEGYKTYEIADLLGMSESAVRKRLQRGRDALRELYEKEAR